MKMNMTRLVESCQKLVVEAENDADKQFYIGTFLIEEKYNFPLNIDLGIKYLERSISGGSIESALNLSNIFIQGRLVTRDLKRAKKYLSKYKSDARTSFCYGLILKKENEFKEARQIFQRGTELGDSSCMYEYRKMVFKGEEGYKDIIDAINFIQLSKGKGYPKSKLFLQIFDKMKKDKSFSGLPPEVQYFFIKQNVRYNKPNSANDGEIKMNKEIKMKFKDTEKLFLNKSFESTNFIEFLQRFEYIEIEILYPTKLFDNIFNQIISIKQNIISKLILRIFISGAKSVSKKFRNNQFIDIVNIDSGIKTIKTSAFEYCASLKYISIPTSVTSIGDCAFNGCSSLTEITIPSSVTEIGWKAFSGCSSLREITIPSSITEIGFYAFRGFSSLREITISSSVTEIVLNVFDGIKSLTISGNIEKITNGMFSGCLSLREITIPSSVTSIGDSAFELCRSLREITIPSSLISIGNSAFNRCSSMTEITILSSVTSIGDYAFEECSSLTEIY
ncbi:hypothetical protein M9Y10_026404 [Tritrichomonas musculus]|uniref:Uncharacterized protein n=1 Tax=Tritrichomonas musculus TaxID=1915356 RepID=A0ABR2H7G1_9EUKA